jgi:5,10-methylenetetrahydrofolate reductase
VLVPENAIGIPTISSLVVAREVSALGGTPIAVLNARDRSLLGLQRDLLTAVASGTDELLLVTGDRSSETSSELTVRSMVLATRNFCGSIGVPPISIGVAGGLGSLPAWKHDADRLFLQATFSIDALLEWRERTAIDIPVYAGVIVPPSAERARQWNAHLPGITVPDGLIEALEDDGTAGVEFACAFIDEIERSGAFDGVHLIAGVRYREMAIHLERRLRRVAASQSS